MNISMVGIDYHTANIVERGQYALTNDKAINLGRYFIQEKLAYGCVILATCNRTEIWFSGVIGEPKKQFLKAFHKEEMSENLFVERKGIAAIHYLMELGCGIHSQIFGEDQILTQMKQAMVMARENKYIDSVLETLFRQAITAAKKVKTSVRLTLRNESIPLRAVELISEDIKDLKNKKVLVIGNGKMGRMLAVLFLQRGAKVTMTLRQYKTFDAIIPDGVEMILYEERYKVLANMDVVVSATRSPHDTIRKEKMQSLRKKCIYIDLAVPRDIDPEIGLLPETKLYNIDDLGINSQCETGQLEKAEVIIKSCMKDFIRWYECRGLMPDIQFLGERIGELVEAKLTMVYRSIPLYGEEEVKLRKNVQKAVEQSMIKFILSMRNKMDDKEFKRCMDAFIESANEITFFNETGEIGKAEKI